MRTLLIILSVIGLMLTILPSVLVFNGIIEMKSHYMLMAIGMIVWFATAPFWMKSKSLEEEEV